MEAKITIRTKTTAEDFRTLTFFNLFLKKRIMIYFLAFALIFALAAVIGRLSGTITVPNWYYNLCFALLGLILLQLILFEFSVRRFLKSDKLVTDNERAVTIDGSGVTAEGGKENGSGEYQWDVFYSVYETKKYFYLYINTAQAIILPKRDFKPEEVPVLEKLIREKLGKRFVKRCRG
ncbi:MAG TPA: YcxB family protein [Anaerovoracaceae bacterium]|nr:YcxB family protein [Anaerovoracaceae bacterium]